jgi:hypothetical protein
MTKVGETGFVQHKRGHNAIMTGLALMVFAFPFLFVFPGTSVELFIGLTVLAGFITLMAGIGMRRETPA